MEVWIALGLHSAQTRAVAPTIGVNTVQWRQLRSNRDDRLACVRLSQFLSLSANANYSQS